MLINPLNKMKNEMENQYTPAQIELIEMVIFNDALDLANDLMLIHDIALYHSDYCIDEKEKTALYQLKQLSGLLKQISKES
jgi:hypothetical protein